MGFLDKLLGRKKDSGMGTQTAPPPASTPAEDTHDDSHEGEHDDSHEGHTHEDDAGTPPA